MAEIRIDWSGFPVGKGRPRAFRTRSGGIRTYTPDKTVDFEERIRYAARAAMDRRGLMETPCRVEVEARFPLPKSARKVERLNVEAGRLVPHTVKPDADNVLKAILDALNGIVYADDRLAYDVRITKRYATEPGITVYVSEI